MSQVIEVQITDNSDKVLDEMNMQVFRALMAIGQEAEGYAKDNCPVDTGRLRNSIANTVNQDEKAVYIGTNVEYAPYVEYMDYRHKVGQAHFLRDAASTHTDHYMAILEASLKGSV